VKLHAAPNRQALTDVLLLAPLPPGEGLG
jgi:hypothetical protein